MVIGHEYMRLREVERRRKRIKVQRIVVITLGLVAACLSVPRFVIGAHGAASGRASAQTFVHRPRKVTTDGAEALLEPGKGSGSIFGEVYLAPQTPAAGVAVALDEPGVKPRVVRTDKSGQYRFDALPRDCGGLVRANLFGYATATTQLMPLAAGEKRRLGPLVLAVAARAECRVSTADGKPVERATVEAYPGRPDAPSSEISVQLAWRDVPIPAATATTNSDGVAAFPCLGAGPWTFVARKPGFVVSTAESVLAPAEAGSPSPVPLRLVEGSRLAGRVVDGAGHGLTGLVLWAEGTADGRIDPRAAPVGNVRAVTDRNGGFVFGALPQGAVRIFVSRPGSTRLEYAVVRVPLANPLVVTLEGARIHGVVRDVDTGAPVRGAVVTGVLHADPGAVGRAAGVVRAVTDATGEYAIDALVAAKSFAGVSVKAEGVTIAPEDPAGLRAPGISLAPRATTFHDIRVRQCARIVGQVTCDGRPVAGVEIEATERESSSTDELRAPWTRRKFTDVDGRYALDGCPRGWAEVVVRADGYSQAGVPAAAMFWPAQRRHALPTYVEASRSGDVAHDVSLVRVVDIPVSGRVVDAQGRPVAGASILATYRRRTVSLADGTFHVACPVDPVATLSVAADGFVPADLDVERPTSGDAKVEVRLVAGARVRGVVSGPDGPIPGAIVQIAPARDVPDVESPAEAESAWRRVQPHAASGGGRFEIGVARASGQFSMRASAPGYATSRPALVVVDAAAGVQETSIRLEKAVQLRGRVVREDDERPIAGARVAVDESPCKTPGASARTIGTVAATTDAEGRFVVDGLAPGRHDYVVAADGYLVAAQTVTTAGEAETTVRLAWSRPIEGVVVSEDGTPLPGCAVGAAPAGRDGPRGAGRASTVTDDAGRFRLDPIAQGTYAIAVTADVPGKSLRRTTTVDASAAPAVKQYFLSFLDYQDLVMFHPKLGYYSSGRVNFSSDYRTFPGALAPYFGHMIAEHIFNMWDGMRKAGTLSETEKFTIAEFGAGDGQLAESILDYIDHRAAEPSGERWKQFANQLVYACYDRSPALSAKQKQRNARFGARFAAREGDATDPTATVKAGSLKGVVLSNELPDAFSAHKVVLSPSGSIEVGFVAPTLPRAGWTKLEKDMPKALQTRLKNEDAAMQTKLFGRRRDADTVYLSKAGFIALMESFASAKDFTGNLEAIEFHEIYVPVETVPEVASHLRQYIPAYAYELARSGKGFAAYINLGEGTFIQGAGRILKSGYVFTIDYGSNWDEVSPLEFDHFRSYGPGSQSSRSDPYHWPTLNDMTTDVNFSHVMEEGKLAGLHPMFFGSQHSLITGTPIVLETTPPNRDPEDFQSWVASFYSWNVYKLLIQQKENTDPAYNFPDKDPEPLTLRIENLTDDQQKAEKEIEQRLRERLAPKTARR